MRYALKPGFQFRPEDLVQVPDGGPDNAAPAQPATVRRIGPAVAPEGQGKLDLRNKPRRPWEDAHPMVTKPFNLRPKEELHMKLKWLAERMPATSMQKIAMQGIEKEVDRLIAIYDTPDRD